MLLKKLKYLKSYLSICLNTYLLYLCRMDTNNCIRLFADEVQINACKDKLKIAQKSFSQLSHILALAGNEVRLKIVYLLEEEKELCPCDLADILGMTIPAVSQHLRKLKDGNLITSRREGQTIYYSLTDDNFKILKSFFKHINQQTEKLETV
jgi:DNA-binding transcriptional ArsR family regulator